MLEDETLASLAAIPTPSPPVSDDEVFTSEQWTTLLAISEVFLPDLTQCLEDPQSTSLLTKLHKILPSSENETLIKRYLAETITNDATFKESIRQRLVGYVPKAQSKGLAFLLSALNTRVGCLIMTGSTELFIAKSLTERTRIVFSWTESYLGPLRAFYGGVESLTRATWLASSNTLHQLLNYPKVPKNIERHPSHDFKFLDFSTASADEVSEMEVDVVIIGSGCGAGVVAEHLSNAFRGLVPECRIMLLEKGYHFPSSHFPMDQAAAGVNIQEGGGTVMSDDGSIAVLAGSTFGGGGTINWSASLQPHRKVREEWASTQDLPFLTSRSFQECLDEVCDKMGVCRAHDTEGLSKIEQNYGNAALLESSRRLGYHAAIVPQNTAGKRHYCGRCGMGCASATKQGPANFWLPAAKDVTFVQGCFVDNITWDETKSPRTATGIRATWQSQDRSTTRKLKISAKSIVLSAGTLHSPLLLHRSGLTPAFNSHIGAHLHLHPTATVKGTYEDRVDPWDGSILTSVMTSLEDLDGKGHGPKIELLLGIPELAGILMPLRPQLSLKASAEASSDTKSADQAILKTALDWRVRVAENGHSFTYIAIQRDHANESNSKRSYVYQDAEDLTKVKIKYTPSLEDRKHLIEGLIAAARMHYVMNARSIELCSPLIEPFERSATSSDEDFEDWISSIRNLGPELLNPAKVRLGSAHQMGTCRMASSAEKGVVDATGKVFGTENVFIADASILPSASGVNPMITTMGFSLHVARGIAESVKNEYRKQHHRG